MRNALSVDVEEWFQVGAFERVIDRDTWPALDARVERNTGRILDLFDQAGVKATFFTLGWVADRHPALIRVIAERGHELASHGWDHQRVFTLDAEGFRADLRQARTAIEQASGHKVVGYRAPSFSIDSRTPWAHEVLAEEDYAYSSSVAPIAHDHYGWPESPRFAWRPVPGADLVELPVTTARFGNRLFATGGGFFRLFPYALSSRAIARTNRVEKRPAIFYFHPWEIDPGQPRVKAGRLSTRIRHYGGLKRMERKLARLLSDHLWTRTDEIAAEQGRRL